MEKESMGDRNESSFWDRKVPQTPGEKIFLLVDHQGLSNNLLQISDSLSALGGSGRFGFHGLFSWKTPRLLGLMGIFQVHSLWGENTLLALLSSEEPEAQSCSVSFLRLHSLWAEELGITQTALGTSAVIGYTPLPFSEVALFDWESKPFCSLGFLSATFLACGPTLWLLSRSFGLKEIKSPWKLEVKWCLFYPPQPYI